MYVDINAFLSYNLYIIDKEHTIYISISPHMSFLFLIPNLIVQFPLLTASQTFNYINLVKPVYHEIEV